MKFTLTDIDYDTNIKLYGETDTGERVVIQDKEFKPFFYAKGLKEEEIKKIKIGLYEVTSTLKEKDKTRVTINTTEGVPIISEAIISQGGQVIEKDIPFTQRYLITKGLKILEGVNSENLTKTETKWAPRVLALDIETTNKKGTPDTKEDEILMISLWSNYEIKKVLITKETKEKNTQSFKTEKEMLQELNKIILETKPNIIVTYNGDMFDWPFIRDRMNTYKINRPYGYDGSNMTIIKKETSASARIKGLAHIDLYVFISKLLSAQLKTSSLDLNSVANELIGEGKKEIDWDKFYKDYNKGNLKKIIEYSLNDARITYELFNKLKDIIIELSRLVNEPMYETSRSSYSSLVENYLINRAGEFNEEIPHRPASEDVMIRTRTSFTGGYVHEPKAGIYENIAVLDFRSLYPSIIVSYNIGPSSLNKKGIKVNVESKTYEFSQEPLGFIPLVVKDLVETRAKIKKELKNNKNPILEARSNAIKTITNALYGYLSYPRSRWYCFECAESITALGRKHVKEVIDFAEESGFNVCYGDTDSAFLTLGKKSKEELNDFLKEVNKKLPGIMELELEHVCPRGLFIAGKKGEKGVKKRYALIDEKEKLIIKGFEFVRGDWSNISRETQYKVFIALLKENSKEKAINTVKEMINALRNNTVPLKDLLIREQITMNLKDYKAIGPHVAVAKRLSDKGIIITPGTIISYIVTEGKGLIREKSKTIEEVEKDKLKPDAEYYIHHQVIPTVDRILDLLEVKEDDLSSKNKKETQQKMLNRYF